MNRRLALLACLSLLVACEREAEVEYDHSTLKAQSTPPGSAEVSEEQVRVTNGLAVLVKLAVYKDPDEKEPFSAVNLSSDDPRVLDVLAGPEPDTFVLVARSVGRTSLSIEVDDGKFVHAVEAEVIAQ